MKKKFTQFTESVWYDIDNKLKILKSYIHILGDNEDYDLYRKYFIIIHNWLIIERMFYDEVKSDNKELNKHLNLEKLNSVKEVIDKFTELYDTYSNVRFAVETFDSIESIRKYLKERPEVYNRLIKA